MLCSDTLYCMCIYILFFCQHYCQAIFIISHSFYTVILKGMLLSKNISYLNTVGHTKLYTDTNCQSNLTTYVRDLLNTKSEYSGCKTENAHTHSSVLDLDDLKVSCDTHKHILTSHFTYTLYVTHPHKQVTRHLNLMLFLSCVHHTSTRGNTLFLIHSSVLWNKDDGSPLVLLCLHKIPLHLYVKISQDVTVKRHVKVLNCRPINNPSMSL
jgi:hypothetical protein